MSTSEPSWELFSAFLAVMETGSLSGAARTLGVAQPTVRRQVEKLEDALEVVLFTRAVNGLVPTAVATATLPYAQSIAASARAFVRSVSGTNEAHGTVRLACSEVIGAEVVPAMLLGLASKIQIELVVSNRNEDLVRRDADLAIRMVRPTQAGLVARRIGVIQVALFATAGYLRKHPSPRTQQELRGHALIGGDRDRSLVDLLGFKPSDFVFRCDNQLAQLAAVRAGLGIGVCQQPLAHELVPVLPKLRFPLETWIVMHEDLRASTRVRAVFDHLVAGFASYVA